MYDITQNPFHLYSLHRKSVSGERSRVSGPLVLLARLFSEKTRVIAITLAVVYICGIWHNSLKQNSHFINSTTHLTLL